MADPIPQANRGLVEALDRLESIACRGGQCICPIGQCDADTIRQALASISSPEASTPSAEWRERVARIIDPWAWSIKPGEEVFSVMAKFDQQNAAERRETSLAKADEIAAVSGGVQGSVDCSAEPSLASRVPEPGPATPSGGA